MIISFIFFLAAFVVIGLLSARYRTATTADYLLASKDVKPWLVGLSFFATENSAWMFVGYIGLAYKIGFSAIWVLIGWYVGEVIILSRTAKKIRQQTDKINAQTYSGLLGRWTGEEYKWVRTLSALITVIFLGVYAAAQLNASGKALNVLTGIEFSHAAIIGFFIILAYCLAGGLRATIWTDAAQALVMLLSLVMIVIVALGEVGDFSGLMTSLNDIDPNLTNVFHGDYKFGLLGFFFGWLFAGVGVLGQPHAMVRFMVVDKPENVRQAIYYYGGMVTILSVLTTLAAVCARVLLPDLLAGDPELALPTLSMALLPEILVGFFLAGLFAAAISTADSQVLSSSAALTRDLTSKYKDSYVWTKVGTILVASIALLISLTGSGNVFTLVIFAWSVMAAAFAPLMVVYTLGHAPKQPQALLMMVGGVVASLAWDFAGLSGDMYNVLPGFVTGLALFYIPRALRVFP